MVVETLSGGREAGMCLTCGCGRPHDDHGDPAHITYEGLKNAAEAAGISVEEAASNLQQTLPKA
jgi:hypothetical protein